MLWPGGLCVWCGVCKFIGVATAAGCTVLCGLVVVVVLFENSIVCQCTFFKCFFHAPWHVDTAAVCVVVVLWCLLFVVLMLGEGFINDLYLVVCWFFL